MTGLCSGCGVTLFLKRPRAFLYRIWVYKEAVRASASFAFTTAIPNSSPAFLHLTIDSMAASTTSSKSTSDQLEPTSPDRSPLPLSQGARQLPSTRPFGLARGEACLPCRKKKLVRDSCFIYVDWQLLTCDSVNSPDSAGSVVMPENQPATNVLLWDVVLDASIRTPSTSPQSRPLKNRFEHSRLGSRN